jgi:hypothetical protein
MNIAQWRQVCKLIKMSTSSPTTASPTMSRPDQAGMSLLMVGLLIASMCLALMLFLFLFRTFSESTMYRLKKKQLEERRRALTRKLAENKTSVTDEEIQSLLNDSKNFDMQYHNSIYLGVGESFTHPLVESTDAHIAYEIFFHTGLGRTVVLFFLESNTQISWMLAWMTTYFMQQLIQSEIINQAVNVGNALASVVGLCFAVYFFHRMLFMSAQQYITSRMGGNLTPFADPPWAQKPTT